jgi:hypothetical protein
MSRAHGVGWASPTQGRRVPRAARGLAAAVGGALLCACILAAAWYQQLAQSKSSGPEPRVELLMPLRPFRLFQELASAPKDAPRTSRLRADLSRLERDIEDADKRSHSRTIPSSHQDARELLARHTAGALRRLDQETSKLLDQWLGGARPRKNASPQQVRDELAFGKRAYARVREQERDGDREEERADRREDLPRSSSRERRREDGRSDGEERGQRSARREGDRAGAREGLDERQRRWEEQSQIDKAERKAEARVEAFVTRKAQAMQRLYRKEQVPVFPVPAVRRWRIWQASDV